MKIVYLAFVRLPTEKAHGLQIVKTCAALAARGAEVELVVPDRATPIEKDVYAYYGVQPVFRLTRLAVPDLVRFGTVGFVVSLLWFSERAKFLQSFWSADVIYSRDALILLQYLLLGRRIIFEAHRVPSTSDILAARLAQHVFVINRALYDAYIARGIVARKLTVLHDAADASSLSDARSGVVYAGSMTKEKGAQTFGDAALLLPPDIPVFAYGRGDQELLGARVQYGGVLSPIEVIERLARAKVVVVPNSAESPTSSVFTSPMKLFEALGSGAVVVASDTPALREVVNEETVVFFKPDNAKALRDAILDAYTNPAHADKPVRARALVQHYSWASRAAHILDGLSK